MNIHIQKIIYFSTNVKLYPLQGIQTLFYLIRARPQTNYLFHDARYQLYWSIKNHSSKFSLKYDQNSAYDILNPYIPLQYTRVLNHLKLLLLKYI